MKTFTPHVDKMDLCGMTPLMHAAFHDEIHLMKNLLAKGARVEAQDRYGSTPLMWAAFFGHTEAVSLLLKQGACLNKCNAEGNTAEDIARKYRYEDVLTVFAQERERRSSMLYQPKIALAPKGCGNQGAASQPALSLLPMNGEASRAD